MTTMTQPAIVPTTPTPAADTAGTFSSDVIAEVFGPDAAEPAKTDAAADAPVTGDALSKLPLEPKPEEPKEKPTADRLAAAIRAERRAEQQRLELAAKKKELDDREASFAPTKDEIALFQQDPAAFVAKKNWSQKQVSEFLEKLAGTYKPEALQDQKLTAVEQELADLKKKLADDETAKTRAQTATQQRATEEAAGKAFVQHIAGASEKYPYIVKEFTETEAVQVAFEALSQTIGRDADGKPVSRLQAYIAQHGESPSDEVIAEHINSIAQKRIETRAKASWGKAGNAPVSAGQAAPTGDQTNAPQVTGASPRTISRADTSSRAAAPRTKGNVWTEADQAEADEASMRILASATRKL